MSRSRVAASLISRLRAAAQLPLAGPSPSGRLQQAAGSVANAPRWLQPACASRQSWRTAFTDAQGYTHFKQQQQPQLSNLRKYVIGCGSLLFGAYYVSSREEIPYTHRKHAIMFVSREMEREIGEDEFESVKAKAEATGKLLPDGHPKVQLVQKIGSQIARVACQPHGGGNIGHMEGLKWEYAVINSPDINAFVLPGGKVVVFTGLMDILHSEAELAAVIGHETAHVLARHHAERMTHADIQTLFHLAMSFVFDINIPHDIVHMGFTLPHSRKSEIEADIIGVQLMARSCYDPEACLSMLQKLGKCNHEDKGIISKLMRTHPLSEDRVKAVQVDMPRARESYIQAGCTVVKDEFFSMVSHFK